MGINTCISCGANDLQEDFKYCPYCGEKLITPGKCPICEFINDNHAKFCQECGTPLTSHNKSEKIEVLDYESVPKQGITIEFGYSSSPNFDLAYSEASNFPSFKQFGEGKKATHRIFFDSSDITSTIELVEYIRGWKSSRIYIDGERSTWENVYSFTWCMNGRNSSFKPELYCFGYENDFELNLWGCKQARMAFREHADWFEWGEWINKNGDWKFDKERIQHELQIELFKYRYCPYLDLALVEDVLNAIPEIVNPTKNKNWKFIESWSSDSLTSGLRIITKRFGYEDEVVMKCVAPNGAGAIKEIIHRMRHKIPKEILK